MDFCWLYQNNLYLFINLSTYKESFVWKQFNPILLQMKKIISFYYYYYYIFRMVFAFFFTWLNSFNLNHANPEENISDLPSKGDLYQYPSLTSRKSVSQFSDLKTSISVILRIMRSPCVAVIRHSQCSPSGGGDEFP